MTNWALTEKGRELLEEYVTKDIDFGINELKDGRLFKKVQDGNFISTLDGKIDRKSVYSTMAISMKQLIKCYAKRSVVWGMKMNLLIGILLYNEDSNEEKLSERLEVTKATVNEHLTLLEGCDLIKRRDKEMHLSDFL